jgi:hypothetical protein
MEQISGSQQLEGSQPKSLSIIMGTFRGIAPLCLVIGGVTASYGQSFLTNGLIAHYPFNGNANDASGNGYHLLNYGATYGPDQFANGNSAAYFNPGASRPPTGNLYDTFGGQYMLFPTNALLDNLTAFSISLWIRSGPFLPPAFGNGAAGFLLRKTGVINFYQQGNSPQLFAFGTGSGWGVDMLNTTNGISTNGVWVHLTMTGGPNGGSFYVNGKLAVTTTNTVSPLSSQYRMGLGPYYNGAVDNLRFYNRILSSREVASLSYYESKKNVQFVKMYSLDFDGLAIGTNYQLQVSTNLLSWTNWGTPFTATTESYTNAVPIQRVDDWGKIFFRLNAQ